jgi:hypothetical protein
MPPILANDRLTAGHLVRTTEELSSMLATPSIRAKTTIAVSFLVVAGKLLSSVRAA